MGYLGLIFISLSIIILSYAAFTATKLVRIAMWKKPWLAFTVITNMLLLSQIYTLYQYLAGVTPSPDVATQSIYLLVAILFAYTTYQTTPNFQKQRITALKQEQEKNEAQNLLAIINKLSSDLIKLDTPDDLAWYVASEVVGKIGLEDCIIYLLDEDTNDLVQVAAIGPKCKADNVIDNPIKIPVGSGLTGWSALNQKPIIVEDVLKDKRYIADLSFAGSEICVPIVNEGRIFGVIDSENPAVGFYTEKHLELLQTVASMLASRLAQWDTLKKLAEAKQQLIEAQSISHCGNWSWNMDSNVLYWSDEVYRIFGFEPRSFEPSHSMFLSLLPEADKEKVDGAIDDILKNKITGNYNIDHPIITPSGELKYVNQHVVASFTEDGKPIGMSGTTLDITERKIAEIEAKEAKEQLSDVFTLAPEAIITFDKALNIELFNKGAERIFQYKSSEVVGKHLNLLIPEKYHKTHEKHMKSFIFSDEEYQSMDKRSSITGIKKDGICFPAMASVSKQKIKDGFTYTVLLRDITKKIQSESKLKNALIAAENANIAKSAFLAAMSHELRTPLNAIMGFSQIIDNIGFDDLGKKKIEEYSGHINQSSRTLLKLLDNVLDISNLEANEYVLNKTYFDAKQITKEGYTKVLKLADYKKINMSLTIDETTCDIYGDPHAFQKIITNSLANAIQFTSAESDINLKVRAVEGAVEISITSHGVSITPEELIFMQNPIDICLDNPHHAIDGTRLNLLIVKSLVELHKGERSITTSQNGEAYINITLPMVE